MWKKELEKYFHSLVRRFIKKPIPLIFKYKDCLGKVENGYVGGNAQWKQIREKHSFLYIFEWWGKPKDRYIVSFLNKYRNNDEWRGVSVHEFTHVYLYVVERKGGNVEQDHDEHFYSKMDYFEDWLDKEWNLPARKNKKEDWEQHINPVKKWERKIKYSTNTEYKTEHKVKFPIREYGNPIFGEPVVYLKTTAKENEK
jgi:hypothetical protein